MEDIKTRVIFGVSVLSASMSQTVKLIKERIEAGLITNHVVLNAAKIVSMHNDDKLLQYILDADLVNADGMSVVWAAKLLGEPLPERVAGIDLMAEILKMAHESGLKCYFLGASEQVLKRVVDVVSEQYSAEIIAGYRNGYFPDSEEADIVEDILGSGAHILFIGISSPKKEMFVDRNKDQLSVPFVMGVGGSFDVIAGLTTRAPVWMQNSGLEWFFRLIQEPGRMWRRYLIGNLQFLGLVINEKFKRNPSVK